MGAPFVYTQNVYGPFLTFFFFFFPPRCVKHKLQTGQLEKARRFNVPSVKTGIPDGRELCRIKEGNVAEGDGSSRFKFVFFSLSWSRVWKEKGAWTGWWIQRDVKRWRPLSGKRSSKRKDCRWLADVICWAVQNTFVREKKRKKKKILLYIHIATLHLFISSLFLLVLQFLRWELLGFSICETQEKKKLNRIKDLSA